jgi:hypothetical protein
MDEAVAVLERLARIDALEPGQGSRVRVLGELRELVREAEAWARLEGDERARSAVVQLGTRFNMNLVSPEHDVRHDPASSIVSMADH